MLVFLTYFTLEDKCLLTLYL